MNLSFLIFLVIARMAFAETHAEAPEGNTVRPVDASIKALRTFFAPNENKEDEVTFKLTDAKGKTPRILLFDAADATEETLASSIRYWRGDTKKELEGVSRGAPVYFEAIRFIRVPGSPEDLVVRLVGAKNEFEYTMPQGALKKLESGEEISIPFGPSKMNYGIISATTDANMKLKYDPQTRKLTVPSVSGGIEWATLTTSGKDRASLENLAGKLTRPQNVPPRGTVLKP